MKILKKIIKEISQEKDFVFVSVGANDGIFVDEVYHSKLLKSGWKSLFIEPVKETFEKLVENYTNLYPNNNFLYENYAIHIEEGDGELITEQADDSRGMCSFLRSPTDTSIKIPVKKTRFKQLLEKHKITKIDFLKVDCEGMDYEIILQILELNIQPKVILFEDICLNNKHGIRNKNDFLNTVKLLEYEIITDIPEIQFEEANKLAIRKDLIHFLEKKNTDEEVILQNLKCVTEQSSVLQLEKTNTEVFSICGVHLADAGFYINLEKSKDREQHVKQQIKKYNVTGLKRFEALTDEFHQSSATKSQKEVYRTANNLGVECVFVAEDDFNILDFVIVDNAPIPINIYLQTIKNELDNLDWDVFLFGCTPKTHLIPVSKNISIVSKSTGAWAYLIKKDARNYILKNFNYYKDLLACDDILPLLNFKGFKTLCSSHISIHHSKGFESTLQPTGPVNYDLMIEGSYAKYLPNYNTKNWYKDYKIERNLTIVIAGHLTENYLHYLRYLLYSLPTELQKCRFLVYYDRVSPQDDIHKLIHYFYNRNVQLTTNLQFVTCGLIDTLKHAMRDITTPCFMLLEHDWVFLENQNIDFYGIIECFEKYNFINSVYFNKNDNVLRGFEVCRDKNNISTPFEREKRVEEIDLVTTCRWSNNPAIHRTSKYREWYKTYLEDVHGNISHKQSDVEEVIIPKYRECIENSTWENVRDDWGTFLYGKIGDGPFVGHTDASRRYLYGARSQPEINGDAYINRHLLPLQD